MWFSWIFSKDFIFRCKRRWVKFQIWLLPKSYSYEEYTDDYLDDVWTLSAILQRITQLSHDSLVYQYNLYPDLTLAAEEYTEADRDIIRLRSKYLEVRRNLYRDWARAPDNAKTRHLNLILEHTDKDGRSAAWRYWSTDQPTTMFSYLSSWLPAISRGPTPQDEIDEDANKVLDTLDNMFEATLFDSSAFMAPDEISRLPIKISPLKTGDENEIDYSGDMDFFSPVSSQLFSEFPMNTELPEVQDALSTAAEELDDDSSRGEGENTPELWELAERRCYHLLWLYQCVARKSTEDDALTLKCGTGWPKNISVVPSRTTFPYEL
ncbi:hypothetical protein BDW59DRAFT_163270 [Aspergillus cavernicola]|uniref:Uncharacterized protein n=1 Tax=Aspergillus cavernicola TaxID=176166 RepID=A0ABR4I6V7_9EURO